MSPENPRILRYSQALLLALRKSPLIQKPEGLISVAELMSQPPERSNKNNHNHNDPTVPKTGSERASRFADKELVFGPPKMNFASAQSTGLRASEDSNDMHKVVKSPDEPQSKISVLDRTTMRPISSRSRESHGRLGLNGDDNGSHTPRLEKKPVGRDGDRPEKQVERNASVGSMRVRKDEGGSWRDRSEGTGPPRPVPVKSADPWSSGTTQPRRGQRDHHPEWMNADTEKISFSGPTTPADEEQPSSGVADDDIQRFKAQMRRRERVAKPESGQQPTGQVVNQTQNISLPPTPAVQSPSAKQQEAESVDSFFDMNFDVHRVPVNQIFEKPVNEKKSSAEKSRFARFWSEEPERPPTLHTSAPPPDTMHRIGISDLFTSARMNGPQEPYGYPAARGNLPSQNAEQRYPQMMSEDDVISAYNKNRPPMSDRSAPINPSDEDRAGINRVMEKLAVFGINQSPTTSEGPSYPPMNGHMGSGMMHSPHEQSPYMSGPPPPMQQFEKDIGRFHPHSPHSLYSNNVNMGIPDDPSSQLTAMIQAASKAKQNHQFPQDGSQRFKAPIPLEMMGGGGPYHEGGLLPPGVSEHMTMNGGPPPFMPVGPPMNAHLPPHYFPPNGPVPFLPPHMLPPNAHQFPPRPPHPGMFPGHQFGPMPPPYPVFLNQQGLPLPMKGPPGTERLA